MYEKQQLINVTTANLVNEVKKFSEKGCRLVQICAAKTDKFELSYSFDKDYEFTTLRLIIDSLDTEVPSVTGVYWTAFLYENEIHDLFGINIKDINIDYKGNFYLISQKNPFNVSTGSNEPKENK